MTSTMNHTDCDHPATKAGRAACRRKRAQAAQVDLQARQAIREAYFADEDLDIILGMIAQAGIDLDPNLDIEEIIASL